MKINIHSKILAVFIASMLSGSLYAGSTPLTKILFLQAHVGDRVFIKTELYNDPIPVCAESTREWAIDVSTNTGKALYSLALAAASQGKNVEIHGNHNCNIWGDREDVLRILVPF